MCNYKLKEHWWKLPLKKEATTLVVAAATANVAEVKKNNNKKNEFRLSSVQILLIFVQVFVP